MKETTHTPGPWAVQPDPNWTRCPMVTSGNRTLDDAAWMEDPACQIICSLRNTENQIANSRLIAAAPELLQALESAFTYLNAHVPKGSIRDSAVFSALNEHACLSKAIHAAIEKARGQ